MCTVQARLPFCTVKISGGRAKSSEISALGRIDGHEESAAARRPIVPRPGLFVRLFLILCGDLPGLQKAITDAEPKA